VKDRKLFLPSKRPCRAAAAVVVMAIAMLGGCATGSPPAAPAVAAAATASEGISPSFTVSGAVGKRASFDLAALQALPVATLTVGANSYTGVSLWALLNDASVGLKPDTAVRNPVLSMYAVLVGAPLGRNGMARLVMAGDVKPGRSVARLAAIEVFAAQPSGR
jgi:hypothetical protein